MRDVYTRIEPSATWPDVCALAAGQLADSLLQFAFQQDRDGDPARLAEAARACTLYIESSRQH